MDHLLIKWGTSLPRYSVIIMLWVVPFFLFGLAVQSVVGSGNYGHSDYVVSTDYASRYHGPGATPEVLPDGTLADTPEVAAARGAHLAALHKAQALWYGNSGSSYGTYSDNPQIYAGSSGKGEQASYVGVPSGHSGYVVSTDYTSRYHGPGATPVVLPDGTLANTPEVASARSAHLTALHKAQALWFGNSGSSHGNYGDSYSSSKSGRYAGASSSHDGAWGSYSGPLASASVLPSGYLEDSSDVVAAKVAHLGAVSQAYAEAAKWPAESGHSTGVKQW